MSNECILQYGCAACLMQVGISTVSMRKCMHVHTSPYIIASSSSSHPCAYTNTHTPTLSHPPPSMYSFTHAHTPEGGALLVLIQLACEGGIPDLGCQHWLSRSVHSCLHSSHELGDLTACNWEGEICTSLIRVTPTVTADCQFPLYVRPIRVGQAIPFLSIWMTRAVQAQKHASWDVWESFTWESCSGASHTRVQAMHTQRLTRPPV